MNRFQMLKCQPSEKYSASLIAGRISRWAYSSTSIRPRQTWLRRYNKQTLWQSESSIPSSSAGEMLLLSSDDQNTICPLNSVRYKWHTVRSMNPSRELTILLPKRLNADLFDIAGFDGLPDSTIYYPSSVLYRKPARSNQAQAQLASAGVAVVISSFPHHFPRAVLPWLAPELIPDPKILNKSKETKTPQALDFHSTTPPRTPEYASRPAYPFPNFAEGGGGRVGWGR